MDTVLLQCMNRCNRGASRRRRRGATPSTHPLRPYPPARHHRDSLYPGTHCAATAAGKDYGIAPKANVYAMQVLGPDGTGSTEGILKAMDAVAEVVKKGKVTGPTVISMSLGGPCWESTQECAFDSDYARAIKDLRDDLGVITVVAAGNSNADACELTPAASRAAITVAAMERGDKLSWFSNRCDAASPFSNFSLRSSGGDGVEPCTSSTPRDCIERVVKRRGQEVSP